MATQRKRDYALEYERRRIRAQARGFSSPAEQTRYKKAKAANEAFGKKLTVYNFRQQQAAQQKKRATQTKQAKLKFLGTPTNLRKFGVSEKTFNRMRAENRKFDREKAWGKILYKLDVDKDVNNYSEDRIGYIVGYNQVFVHPKTKQLKGKARMAQVRAYEKLTQKYDLLNDELEIIAGRYARELAA
jgi:hypothetical protein